MAKKKALGRGLGALLQEVEAAYENDLADNPDLVLEIDVDLIRPNPLQPRKKFNKESIEELAQSIKEHGLLQPILIYEDKDGYSIIAGERRLRASKLINMQTIKAIVVDIKPERLRELALIENIQREDLNPIDLALSYRALMDDYHITQDELATKVQKSRTQITNTLALLRLPPSVQNLLVERKLTPGHAKILVNLSEDNLKLALDSILGQKLTVAESEKLVKRIKTANNKTKDSKNPAQNHKQSLHRELRALSDMLANLGIKSKINKQNITLMFQDSEVLTNFMEILHNFGAKR